jgi:hypothetical protein
MICTSADLPRRRATHRHSASDQASARSDATHTFSEAIRNPKMSPVEREIRSLDEGPNITSLSPPAGADGTTPTQGSRSSPSNVNGTGTGTGTSGVPNWRESPQRVSTHPPSDTGSMRQNLSNGLVFRQKVAVPEC